MAAYETPAITTSSSAAIGMSFLMCTFPPFSFVFQGWVARVAEAAGLREAHLGEEVLAAAFTRRDLARTRRCGELQVDPAAVEARLDRVGEDRGRLRRTRVLDERRRIEQEVVRRHHLADEVLDVALEVEDVRAQQRLCAILQRLAQERAGAVPAGCAPGGVRRRVQAAHTEGRASGSGARRARARAWQRRSRRL